MTGLTGQDGSFLAELLLGKGYAVTAVVRRPPADSLGAAEHLRDQIELIHGDLIDPPSLAAAVEAADPDEIYHLAAPTFVPDSWKRPNLTLAAIAQSTAVLLEIVRERNRDAKVFVAGSGEMFGATPESPQREGTACRPQTPYATAKLAAHQLVGLLREHDGLFACSGILYNHESERRPARFVSRKITRAAAQIKLGLAREVVLGDLNAVRDWSFAGDVMRGAWLMLQQDRAADCVLASGIPHTVAELADAAFGHVGLDAGVHIRVDPTLVRPPEATRRVGDPHRARERLGWKPELNFEQLVARMVDAEMRALQDRAAQPTLPCRG
ncbi:MAG: GDP-mannose 4,6-dehydratase [Solirubrobacteraceae bacterium]